MKGLRVARSLVKAGLSQTQRVPRGHFTARVLSTTPLPPSYASQLNEEKPATRIKPPKSVTSLSSADYYWSPNQDVTLKDGVVVPGELVGKTIKALLAMSAGELVSVRLGDTNKANPRLMNYQLALAKHQLLGSNASETTAIKRIIDNTVNVSADCATVTLSDPISDRRRVPQAITLRDGTKSTPQAVAKVKGVIDDLCRRMNEGDEMAKIALGFVMSYAATQSLRKMANSSGGPSLDISIQLGDTVLAKDPVSRGILSPYGVIGKDGLPIPEMAMVFNMLVPAPDNRFTVIEPVERKITLCDGRQVSSELFTSVIGSLGKLNDVIQKDHNIAAQNIMMCLLHLAGESDAKGDIGNRVYGYLTKHNPKEAPISVAATTLLVVTHYEDCGYMRDGVIPDDVRAIIQNATKRSPDGTFAGIKNKKDCVGIPPVIVLPEPVAIRSRGASR